AAPCPARVSMSEGDDMRGERALVDQIRELMEPSNPVPATMYQDQAPYQEQIATLLTELRSAPPEFLDPEPVAATHGRRDRISRAEGRRREVAWRVLAPVLSGLAVVAVVTSLTIAAGQGPTRSGDTGPTTSGAMALPTFYVTVNGAPPHL